MVKKITFALLSLLLVPLGMMAQNVTISPQNGSMICSDASGQGTSGGAFSMWRHEQLALTMVASGSTALTDDGILKNHRNWFNTCNKCTFSPTVSDADKAKFIDCGWQDENGYYTISLPKGYRFTSYRFELSHDITNTGQGFTTVTNTQVAFSETRSDFGTAVRSVTLPAVSSSGTVTTQTLTRTGDDMGNVLYFKATAPSSSSSDPQYFDLTFRYVELTFTADADAQVDIHASTLVTTGQSMVEAPFNTGKVDLGEVTQRAIPSYGDRISYSLTNFADMSANMLLYEAESVHNATGTESFDGTAGDVAYNKAGSITTAGDFFKLTTGTKEQVYYLESPVYATMQNGGKNPIQFRIVGANVEYNNGSSITKTYNWFTISAKRTTTNYYGTTTTIYYVDEDFNPTTDSRYAESWYLDEYGHITNGTRYLALRSINTSNTYATYTTNPDNALVCEIDAPGHILRKDNGAPLNITTSYNSPIFRFQGNQSLDIRASITHTGEQVVKSLSPGTGECTLKVYDKTGNSVVPNGEVTVNSSNKSGNIPLPGLNNDAIKFSVKGTGYVKFSVILQALNPYVDQMSVVMNDEAKNLRMTQTFTSDDFSVGGDTFLFYLPEGCIGDNITMTFEDLYSSYGDDTYDHTDKPGTSDSRYNFVMSQHHQAFTSDNIYNNTTEAANDTKESVRIAANNGAGQNVRTQVGTVGNVAFRFNNADELSTTAGYMTEYPFTLNNYANQTKPGKGSFILASFPKVGENAANDKKTFYVFTTDETKYNIAPTTATQHRSYAFYEMVVQLICADYSPTVTFEKIYSNSFNETGKTEFYGANVSALVGGSQGLAADFAVNKAIAEKIANPGEDDVPASMDQILYLDMSQLKGVFHSDASKQEDKQYEVADFNVLKSKLAKNALVFLPINSTSTFDNFAYALKGQTEGSLTFKAANNIILTDKNPFYTPYTIQVDAAKSARYTRQITKSTYTDETWATVIMPFEISLVDGQHVDEYGTLEFLQMNEKNATADDYNYMGKTIFFSKTNASKVEANTPYALHATQTGVENGVFIVDQKGSSIIATPEAAKSGNTLFSATEITSTGNLTDKDGKNATYTFSHKGSFSGYKIPRDQPKTFYFANNGFYSSVELKSYYTTVDLYPFRSVYEVPSNVTAKVGFLRLVEGENDSETDGIDVLKATSEVDMDAPVYDMQGRMIAPTYREAKSLQSGMYVVNGVKIIVK